MQNQARVVIVGRSLVGALIVFHLSKLSCSDCIMLERSELTSSSTWHAAGGYAHRAGKSMAQRNVPQVIASHDSGWSIEMLDKKFPTKQQKLPLFDPNSLRIWS